MDTAMSIIKRLRYKYETSEYITSDEQEVLKFMKNAGDNSDSESKTPTTTAIVRETDF